MIVVALGAVRQSCRTSLLSTRFTSCQVFHARTLQLEGGTIKVRTNDMKMKMKKERDDDESESAMKNTQPAHEVGNTKEEGKEQTPTKFTWPGTSKV